MAVTKNGGDHQVAELDPSKLIINLTDSPKPLPVPENLNFGETKTDHMLIANYDPLTGWSAPEIKPYGPLILDPSSSCFQYCTNVFEGMKAYLGPDGKPRLFRPELNMARLARSADRVALPPFDTNALLALIKRLVLIDARWIPAQPGYSLYIRPTIIGTRAALGVAASDHACLYVLLSPTGPYFRSGPKAINLLAVSENVRSWPGGTGGHKLGLNYAPGFMPQRAAAKKGYEQILWLLAEGEGKNEPERLKVTEAGAMNFFLLVKRDDGNIDALTPPLDGTILPGLTRSSVLSLLHAHNAGTLSLPGLPSTLKIHTHDELPLTMAHLLASAAQGRITEAFGVGTAVIVAPVGKIGFAGTDVEVPKYEEGLGPVGKALWTFITDVQVGKVEFQGWSVKCE